MLEAVAALPEPMREVLVAVDVLGLSYGEIATLLDVPEGTVKSRIHEARRQLRRSLAGTGR